jgi:hypothetical protein
MRTRADQSRRLAQIRRLLSRGSFAEATDQTERREEADLNEERLWRLLGHGTITVQELREQGVKAPAQGMYELQLAGYVIDRHRVRDEAGQSTLGYRLSRGSVALSDEHPAPELTRERHLRTLVIPPALRSADL